MPKQIASLTLNLRFLNNARYRHRYSKLNKTALDTIVRSVTKTVYSGGSSARYIRHATDRLLICACPFVAVVMVPVQLYSPELIAQKDDNCRDRVGDSSGARPCRAPLLWHAASCKQTLTGIKKNLLIPGKS